MLWAVFTLIAAAAQTARNAMQRELTATLGTVGATHVRFLFGFPFALLFLAGLTIVTGAELPKPSGMFWPWVLAGALHPDRGNRNDALCDGPALVCGGLRLYQNRAGPRGAFRPDFSRRQGHATFCGCDSHRYGRRDCHLAEIRRR